MWHTRYRQGSKDVGFWSLPSTHAKIRHIYCLWLILSNHCLRRKAAWVDPYNLMFSCSPYYKAQLLLLLSWFPLNQGMSPDSQIIKLTSILKRLALQHSPRCNGTSINVLHFKLCSLVSLHILHIILLSTWHPTNPTFCMTTTDKFCGT